MRPSLTLLILLVIWAGSALALAVARPYLSNYMADAATLWWWLAGGGLVLIGLLDVLLRYNNNAITVTRVVPSSLSLGVEHKVKLHIENPLPRKIEIEVADYAPNEVEVAELPVSLSIPANSYADLSYQVTPRLRGDASFGYVALKLKSRFRFWQFYLRRCEPCEVKIYPNFAAISHFALLNHDLQAKQLGIHKVQRRGEGTDFNQLREYREGDVIRQVNWKASARYRKLISNEYQEETDQDIIFLLDCGRRMRAKDDELSHFDHALNATLLAGYVALQEGDAVGLLTFAGEERWIPPLKGKTKINHLLNQVYDLESGTKTSDLLNAAENLMNRHRKRSLVIIVSNLREEDQQDVMAATQLLSKKHLVMISSLRENFLDEVIGQDVNNFKLALNYAGTTHFLNRRQRLLQNLRSQGAIMTDSLPQYLYIDIVNHYLALKRSGHL